MVQSWEVPYSQGRYNAAGAVDTLNPRCRIRVAGAAPNTRLVVFELSGKEFKRLTSYRVAESGKYACPVVVVNRVFIKDQEALTLWSL